MSRAGWAGLAVLAVAWSPLPDLAVGGPFAAHMLRHLLLVAMAAPLLALAVMRQRPAWGRGLARICPPLLASAVELLVVWGWHAPALHHAARAGTVAFLVEQALFLGSGLLLWITALARPPAGVVALLVTAGHMTLLGVLLALSPRPLFAEGHMAHDQELGGVLMLAVAGTAYLAGGLALLVRLLGPMPEARR
jgi:putative membrane protein